jgi:hypothetical protein
MTVHGKPANKTFPADIMDPAAVRQNLLAIEAKIAGGLHQIIEQRAIIARLERDGQPADHAKYLLAGLELLQAAHRDGRDKILRALGEIVD